MAQEPTEIEQLKARIEALEAENHALKQRGPGIEPNGPTVIAPEAFKPLFRKAERVVQDYFKGLKFSPSEGTIEINEQRYVLVRASALSYEFFNSIKDLYANRGEEEAFKIGQNFLFDIAHVLGIEDAKRFHNKMELDDPVSKLSAGPVHFAYAGWALVDILEESKPSPDENYFLKYNHPYSFEADSWLRENKQSDKPVCIMNAAYSSGWCEQSFGIPLTAVEITCKAKGDDNCTFIMAPPDKIHEYLEQEKIDTGSVSDYDVPTFFERKLSEEHIKASLEEKEILLQEIHHRVKNNLQVIVSLMGLQIMNTQNSEAKSILRYSQSRVNTMGMIHEMLYQANDLARIKYGDYVSNLFNALMRTYSINPANVDLQLSIEDLYFGIDTAIPLGLILNELVTNSLKYAFPDDRLGTIYVHISQKEDDWYLLDYKDDGVGLGDDIDLDNPSSLGFKLVNILTAQLDGEIEVSADPGVHFQIKFRRLDI